MGRHDIAQPLSCVIPAVVGGVLLHHIVLPLQKEIFPAGPVRFVLHLTGKGFIQRRAAVPATQCIGQMPPFT